MSIARTPRAAAGTTYDLIILGGGIYGALLALEASLRGLSALVVERARFFTRSVLKSVYRAIDSLNRTLPADKLLEKAPSAW